MQLCDEGYERFNLSAAAQAISEGLDLDGIAVAALSIVDQMVLCMASYGHDHRVQVEGGNSLIPAASLYDLYDLWVDRISVLVEMDTGRDEFESICWPGANLPHTRAALRDVRLVVFGLIESLSQKLNPEDGMTALEVISLSLRTGETLSQCRARAVYNSRGLVLASLPKPKSRSMRSFFNV